VVDTVDPSVFEVQFLFGPGNIQNIPVTSPISRMSETVTLPYSCVTIQQLHHRHAVALDTPVSLCLSCPGCE